MKENVFKKLFFSLMAGPLMGAPLMGHDDFF